MPKIRQKMPREMRAKQFAPFDALKGLSRALKEKERENERNIDNRIEHIKDNDTCDHCDDCDTCDHYDSCDDCVTCDHCNN